MLTLLKSSFWFPNQQSDTFIGHRVASVPDEEAWARASIILNEVRFVTIVSPSLSVGEVINR